MPDSEVPYVFVLAVVPVNRELRSRLGDLLMLYVPGYLKALNDPEWVLMWMDASVERVMGVEPKEVRE